jgi:hypothetical protein
VEKTNTEVMLAYTVARRVAKGVMRKVSTLNSTCMAYEDFVQEGVMAWLEGKSMYYGMIDAFRSQAMISPYSYNTKGVKEPQVLPFEDGLDGFTNPTEAIDNAIDAQKMLKRIQAVEDPIKQFALLGYLYFGMSLREIAEVLDKSHEWVRTYLVEPELKIIREEFQC